MRVKNFITTLSAITLASAANAATVRVCGTVFTPPGVSFPTGQINVQLTVSKYLVGGVVRTTTGQVSVDGATRSFCVAANNDLDVGGPGADVFHTAKVKVSKTNATVEEAHTGALTFTFPDGSSTAYFNPGSDLNSITDIRYLGSSDPLSPKLAFPGLRAFTSDQGLTAAIPSNSAFSNRIVSETFHNGNLVGNGSFENGIDGWMNTFPLPSLTSVQPAGGSQAVASHLPTAATPYDLVSAPFPVKPNTQYTLSFFYRGYSVTGDVRGIIRGYTDSPVEGSNPSQTIYLDAAYTNSGAWTQVLKTFTTWSDVRYATITLAGHLNGGAGGGTFLFDKVILEPGAVSNSGKVVSTVKYHDGLNREFQVLKPFGDLDIIDAREYDDFNRPSLVGLPIGYDYARHTGRHALLEGVINGPTGGHLGFYYGDPSVPSPKTSGYAYTENVYEDSPLGRPLKEHLPGGAWRTANRFIDHAYSGTDNLSPTGGTDKVPTPNSNPKFAYSFAMGEGNHIRRAFKDKLGRVVKSGLRVGTGWVETRSEYDPLGNEITTTAPPGPGNASLTTTREFNSLGQLLTEYSPDFGKIQYIYDKNNRLRFSQTEKQRSFSFDYIKYDKFGRMVEKGEYMVPWSFDQWFADDLNFPEADDVARKPRLVNYYDVPALNRNPCQGGRNDWVFFIRSDADPNAGNEFTDFTTAYDEVYSRLASASSFAGEVKFYQVFDSPGQAITPSPGTYTPFPLWGTPPQVPFKLIGIVRGSSTFQELTGGSAFPFTVQWGPLKDRLVQSVSCNPELEPASPGSQPISTTFNYDKYGNVSESYEYNGYILDQAKRWQKTTQQFDLQNRLVERSIFPDAGSATADVRFTYFYNLLGSLDEIRDKNNVVAAKYYYNSIGQLSGIDVGQGAGQVKLTYAYHFRGWAKKIEAHSPSGTRLFHQELKYEDGTSPRYDGNLAEYNYALTAATVNRYSFSYDAFARLSSATSDLNPSGQTGNSTWGYSYFDNGALRTMTRQGTVYTYNHASVNLPGGGNTTTNRVHSASFTGSSARNTAPANTFRYDASGNLIADDSKFMWVEHTSERPFKFGYARGGNGYSQLMVYDGDGNRRSKLLYRNNTEFISASHYFSSGKEIREVAGQTLVEVYPVAELGRVIRNSSGGQEYEAYIKNHLGSTVKVRNITQNTEVFKSDFEPYGKSRLQVTSTAIPLTPKFTGKEFDEGLDLDYFGARYYDAEMGMWISPDKARQFHSPYAYSPTPMSGTDPDGNFYINHDRSCTEWGTNEFQGYILEDGTVYVPRDLLFPMSEPGLENVGLPGPNFLPNLIRSEVRGAIREELGFDLGPTGFRKGRTAVLRVEKGESSVWKGLGHYRGNIKTSGTGKNTRYYQWDHTHKDIEVYDRKGRHLGSMHAETGQMYKDPVSGRKLDGL